MTNEEMLEMARKPYDWYPPEKLRSFLISECGGTGGGCICRDLVFSIALDGEDVEELP